MSTARPTETVHALFGALNAHDADRAARHIGPSYHGLDATRSALTVGRDEAHAEIRTGLRAFPDAAFTIEQCVTQSPRVFLFWILEGTHESPFLGVPATNRSVTVSGTGLFTVRDQHIVHAVHLWSLAGLMRSAGLLPNLLDEREGAPSAPESDDE